MVGFWAAARRPSWGFWAARRTSWGFWAASRRPFLYMVLQYFVLLLAVFAEAEARSSALAGEGKQERLAEISAEASAAAGSSSGSSTMEPAVHRLESRLRSPGEAR